MDLTNFGASSSRGSFESSEGLNIDVQEGLVSVSRQEQKFGTLPAYAKHIRQVTA